MNSSMMNHSRRDKWTPAPSVKRKERDGTNLDFLKPSSTPSPAPLTTKKLARPSPHHRHPPPLSPMRPPAPAPSKVQPLSNNQLLAGYLANEFLSKGTLFGQAWDPARAEAVPVSSRLKPKKVESVTTTKKGMEADKFVRYKEVTDLMKTDGAHLPGIVNPTQLARFLQIG